jgi:RecA-family ATPase
MTPYDQAARWLDKQPPAVSGQSGHNQTFAVACALVWGFNLSRGDAGALLRDYSARCVPPWSDRDIEHKLADAEREGHKSGKPRGYMLRSSSSYSARRPSAPSTPPPAVVTAPKYVLPESLPQLPSPIEDGARVLLKHVFRQGEGIRIANAKLNEETREVPSDGGIVFSREEWLRKLDEVNGNPNGIWHSTKRTGIYITVNPMRVGGSKDSDVTAFRHVLLEFDQITQQEQWALVTKSGIPCSAVISSGGKSIHAWVKVDAKDRREYDERVVLLYRHFEAYKPDANNRNPSRFSRLPNCVRFEKRQELLALDVGKSSWTEWAAEVQADGIGQTVTVAELIDFKPEQDDNSLLGNRWLCRGGSCLLIGPSGVGKSSLEAQFAATWAMGRPAFGITPVRPLKSLIIQAENDVGDLAEMLQGVLQGLKVDQFNTETEFELLERNLVFVRDTTHTGFAFTEAVRRLIDRHKPDLVWFDPLLSFIGADISKQEVCSEFLRNWLNPISEATGVVWFCVHHTGKPPNDKRAREGWTSSDFAYAGIGSSELTNWARAVMSLRAVNEYQFELKLAKRGKRAGAIHPNGEPTTTLWLRHGDHGIQWLQMDPPDEPVPDGGSNRNGDRKRGGRPSESSKFDYNAFLDSIRGEAFSIRQLAVRAKDFSGMSRATVFANVIPILKERMKQNEEQKWIYRT